MSHDAQRLPRIPCSPRGQGWLLATITATAVTVALGGCRRPPPPPASPATGTPAAPTSEVAPSPAPSAPPVPTATGAVASGRYRSLFTERGYPAAAQAERLSRAFNQLFHGDPDTQAVYYPVAANANGPMAYVTDVGNRDVRSEGMSYGMMIAVQMDKQPEFNALWNWAKTHMDHPDAAHPVHGYFAWQVGRDGVVRDDMPAPDGEEYFITALYFAAGRWGNGTGIYDYRAQADRLLDLIQNRGEKSGAVAGKGGRTAKVTTLFNVAEKQVRFTPDTAYFAADGDHTDPSYHLPAFYELWARFGPAADRPFWADAAHVSRDFLVKAVHPRTGLSPDYATFDGRPKARSTDPRSAEFRFDAWRTAMNWSVDCAWFAADPRQRALSDRIQGFFDGQGLAGYGNNFRLDGTPTGKDHSSGLVAMNAVASLCATDARAWKFVDALWNLPVATGTWRYYDGLLTLLALLHVSGNFRVYAPPAAAGG